MAKDNKLEPLSGFFYNLFFDLIWFFLKVFYRINVIGRENIPSTACIVCANHSSMLDPLCIGLALTKKNSLYFMAKVELFKNKILAFVIRKIGAFPVVRGAHDVSALMTAMRVLKNGDKLCIFPEGTRVKADEYVAAKTGAVRLAVKLNVPLLPIYVPTEKRMFKRFSVVIGEPYYITAGTDYSQDEVKEQAEQLMGQIRALKSEDSQA